MRPLPPGHASYDEAKQRLRVRRFLQASTFSILYLVVLGVYHAAGSVDFETLRTTSEAVIVLVALFYVAFRSGLNGRVKDPSLTDLQVSAAMVTMLYVVHRAPDTRLVFGAFFFVALMFAMLRSRGAWDVAMLGTLALLGFAGVAGHRYRVDADVHALRLDMLQLLAMATALPWFVFVGNQIKRLREADRRKDDFLATLAHELRNPLAPVRTGVQVLRMVESLTEARRLLPMMERQLQHASRLLDDMLEVNRIVRGKLRLHVQRVPLSEVVDAAVEAATPLIEEMRHRLTVDVPNERVALDVDPVRIAQALSNLLTNAAKYTPQGGHIELKARRERAELVMSVCDNGIGIPRDRLTSIFEMFHQIEGGEARSRGGLGIGLALVRAVVAMHGGSVEAFSEGPGRGSEFRMRLPLRTPGASPPRVKPASSGAATKLKVLVADDNRDASSSLSTLLALMGHEVQVADDGRNALRLAEQYRPAVALLDIEMPDIDGYEVCRRIRRQEWGRTMRLVAVTGRGQDEDCQRAASAGFDCHLVKPVGQVELAHALSIEHATV